MNRPVMPLIAFVVTGVIVVAILQYVVHLQGGLLKLSIGAVVGLIVAGITFAMTRSSATPGSPAQ